MAIIGFIALSLFLIAVTAAYLLSAANCMGPYNIGGVPNSWAGRIVCLASGVSLIYLWSLLLSASPLRLVVA